jgi:hypothetical protein
MLKPPMCYLCAPLPRYLYRVYDEESYVSSGMFASRVLVALFKSGLVCGVYIYDK